MSFLGALADQISSQFSLGENTNHTLDSIDPDTGKVEKYGSLGDFAKHFDQSSERRYVEEGYLRKDPYNTDPKQFEVLMQEPNATVLLKKRMFSSVGDNFRPDFMDKDEKLYYRAMKILFQNKCKQIAALEKLSKIQKITSAVGSVPDQLMPIIFTLTDSFNSGLDSGSNLFGALGGPGPLASEPSNFTKVIDRLRRVYAFNTANTTTNWITDSTNLFQAQFGQGTGVIELTNFSSFSTSTSTSIDTPGSFRISIEDPYECMLITEYDIEKAISDATNMFYNKKLFQFAKENSDKLINDLQSRLNKIRASRNASPISIKVDPDTLLGRRVIAILDRRGIELPFTYDSSSAAAIFSGGAFGSGTEVPDEYLRGGSVAGEDGLDTHKQVFSNIQFSSLVTPSKHHGPDSEFSIFNRLISTIYSKLSQDANSRNAFQTTNQNTNYTRRKLRFNFSGKLIVQPMDTAHIYINSKSRWDEKLLSGLQNMFTGLGMLQNINNTLTNLANAVGALNPSGNVPLEIEKSAFVGKDFPNFLWSMVRGQFVSENEGTHVFAGIVQNASDNWSNGKFTIDINGGDNSLYFDMGKINFKPGVDVYNGSIFDPLTPFKSNFDSINSNINGSEIPELLNENKFLLGTQQGNTVIDKSLVKFKLGRYAGQLVNENSVVQDRNFDPVTGRSTKVFYAPDGLVYKWKEGIGVFTQFGTNLTVNDADKVGAPSISKEPFAGQNVMNVLSLLIAGVPYNFATYYKAAVEFDGAGADPQSKQSMAHSFYQSLRTDLVKSNTLWGNFVPFKNLVVDEESYVKHLQKVTTVIQKNKDLDAKIRELQDLNQAAIIASAANAFSEKAKYGDGSRFLPIKAKVDELSKQVDSIIKEIKKSDDDSIQQVGDDTSFDYSEFVDSGKTGKTLAADRRLLRRQLNFLTRRMSYNVRANEDKNLFIVDDFYDKDFDILAYEKTLTNGISLYNNQFTSVRDKIQHVANLLNLEVFCDSQGHIRCRPPQYNRMPSSVFYKMMYLKQSLGIQIFPKFLDDIFKDKLSTLRSRLEVLEDQIRLDCAVLNYNDDSSAMAFILGSGATSGTGDSFAFLSDDANKGQISDFANLIIQANPDDRDSKLPQDLEIFDNVKNKTIKISNKDVFSNSTKYSAIVQSLKSQELNADGIATITDVNFLSNTRADDLINRIFTKSGQRVDKRDYFVKTDEKVYGVQSPINTTIDVFKVIQDLSDKIKERQKALKLFYDTLKGSREFNSLDDDKSTANALITPGVYGNSHIPEVFEHMIEDETYDDYGLNSGKRYIIKRAQIRSLNISENPPDYTAIEVQGQLNPALDNSDLPSGLTGIFPSNGNGLTTAMAVDYDLWRMYGYKQGSAINVPFLSDPVSQCSPYATMLLSRNRKNILRGSVTISGNEFMQPGEVVFLEDRQLLFYVSSVKHNFTFPSSFTTTLDLTYGHPPGEYIPTVSDMIGKMIYNNKDVADLVVHRQETSANEINMGVIIRGTDSTTGQANNTVVNQATPDGFTTTFSAHNAQVINNILYTTQYMINANSNKGNNITARVELRTYYDDKNSSDIDLQQFAEGIRQLLVGSDSGLSAFTTVKQGNPPKSLDPKFVKSVSESTVDLSDENDRRSPSQKAIDAARNHKAAISKNGGGASSPGNNSDGGDPTVSAIKNEKADIKTALLKYVVDCWVSFDPVSPQESNGS